MFVSFLNSHQVIIITMMPHFLSFPCRWRNSTCRGYWRGLSFICCILPSWKYSTFSLQLLDDTINGSLDPNIARILDIVGSDNYKLSTLKW